MKGLPASRVLLINADHVVRDVHRVCTGAPGTLERLSLELDQPYPTTYSQVTGVTKGLPLDVLRAAHFLTGSHVLERHLLWPGRRSVPDVPSCPPSMDHERECGDVGIAAARLHDAVRQAANDDNISPAEDAAIRPLVEAAVKELQDVLALLDAARARGGRLG
jgi:hypothetical protein